MFDDYTQTPHLLLLSMIYLVYAVLPGPMSLVKYGCLKLPSRRLSWLLFLKYPPSRPVSPTHCLVPYLLPTCRRSLCFHTPYEDSRLSLFRRCKSDLDTICLKLSLMSHDIVIYETAFSSRLWRPSGNLVLVPSHPQLGVIISYILVRLLSSSIPS
jgi:hypothetical protein